VPFFVVAIKEMTMRVLQTDELNEVSGGLLGLKLDVDVDVDVDLNLFCKDGKDRDPCNDDCNH
jgi:hypothetical protein